MHSILLFMISVAFGEISSPEIPGETTNPPVDDPCFVTGPQCEADQTAQTNTCIARAAADSASTGKSCTAVYLRVLCPVDPFGCSQLYLQKCVVDCFGVLVYPFNTLDDALDFYKAWEAEQ